MSRKNQFVAFAAHIFALAVQIFVIATIIYWAVDAFALYSENQFTGRMRSFDVDYWNAVYGVTTVLIPLDIFRLVIDGRRAADKSENKK